MMPATFFISATAVFGALGAGPHAVQVATVDGASHELKIARLNWRGGLTIQGPGGDSRRFDFENVDELLMIGSPKQAPIGTWRITLRDGGVVFGDIRVDSEGRIVAEHSQLGDVRIDLRDIADMRRRLDTRLESPATAADAIHLMNGDIVSGAVAAVDGERVTILSGDEVRSSDWSEVRAMILSSQVDETRQEKALQLGFADGSSIRVESLDMEGDRATAARAGGESISFDAAFLRAAATIGGRLVRLCDISPEEYESVPYFEREWPLVVDSNALGGPLKISGREFGHGLGLHAACRVRWRLDGRYERFRALVGIDDSAGPKADAELIVYRDDGLAFRADKLRFAESPRAVDVDLTGAQTLAIHVDFGAFGPVHDRVNLVDPKLILAPSAASRPSSQPANR